MVLLDFGYGKDDYCDKSSIIETTSEGYNRQSPNALGMYAENYSLWYEEGVAFVSWNKDEIPKKDGVAINFETLTPGYHLGEAPNTDVLAKATVEFAVDIDVPENGPSYWWNKSEGKWNDSFAPKEGQEYPYVYDKDNEYCTISQYVENYKDILENENDIEIKEAKLMSYEQATSLGCNINLGMCYSAPSWLRNTSFWLGSAQNNSNVFAIVCSGYNFKPVNYVVKTAIGVRPVITVSK